MSTFGKIGDALKGMKKGPLAVVGGDALRAGGTEDFESSSHASPSRRSAFSVPTGNRASAPRSDAHQQRDNETRKSFIGEGAGRPAIGPQPSSSLGLAAVYDEQPSQPKRKRGNQQSHVTAIDLGSDDDVVEEPKRAPKAPPEEPKKLELQTKRTMLGTWDCGPATVTFTAEKIQWFPAEGRALPGTGEYPLISISLSTVTAFEIDKQNGCLGIWSLAPLPFEGKLGERWSPMWSHECPESSIFIQYNTREFAASWPSQIAKFSEKMKKLSKFVGPGLISGRESKKERKGQVAPLEIRQNPPKQSRGSQQMNKALAEQRDDKPQPPGGALVPPPGVPWFPRQGAKQRTSTQPSHSSTRRQHQPSLHAFDLPGASSSGGGTSSFSQHSAPPPRKTRSNSRDLRDLQARGDAQVVLVYPRVDAKDAVTITEEEVVRLQQHEFLNDSLVDYKLKVIQEGLPADVRAKCHFFNSFFYKRLLHSTKGSGRASYQNPANVIEGYKHVKRWTKNVNLFEKEFIFVPINEQLHWSLMVIYRAGEYLSEQMALRDAVADEEDGGAGASADPQIFPNDDNDTDLDEDELQEDVEEQEDDVEDREDVPVQSEADDVEDLVPKRPEVGGTSPVGGTSDPEELDGEDALFETGVDVKRGEEHNRSASRADWVKPAPPPAAAGSSRNDAVDLLDDDDDPVAVREEEEERPAKKPCILYIDSMNGHKGKAFALLKTYLHLEHQERYGPKEAKVKAEASPAAEPEAAGGRSSRKRPRETGGEAEVIPGGDEERPPLFANLEESRVHVELQHNGYDCGLYMLQYIEKIAKEMPDLACKKRRGSERSVRWEDGGPKLHFTENTIETMRTDMVHAINDASETQKEEQRRLKKEAKVETRG